MALNQTQQILELIKRSARPLICVPKNAGADGYATALGLARVLEKLDKPAALAAAGGAPGKNLDFLGDLSVFQTALHNLQKFVIELNAKEAKIDELSYEVKDDRLQISLSPKQGVWQESDVRLHPSEYRYDLIIAVGAPDLELFGGLFAAYPDFFFKTPIINLDHVPENEYYGQINLVDLNACACGEVAYHLVEDLGGELLDDQMATAFLTGMVAKTKSFKNRGVTPQTLLTASRLIARGARRDLIVDNLYRTRSVSTLRLWGRALARLKADPDCALVWTMLSRSDFMHAGALEEDLPGVIDELIASSPEAKVIVVLYEDNDGGVCGLLRAERPYDAISLATAFRPSGTREEVRLYFAKKNIVQVEKEFLPKIKEEIAQQQR
jgi:nanoRNase/pAp phosphatase (c-di-AMP/oligoRNAs hydrolase)